MASAIAAVTAGPGQPSREQAALLEISRTEITRPAAWLLVSLVMLPLALVPLWDSARAVARQRSIAEEPAPSVVENASARDPEPASEVAAGSSPWSRLVAADVKLLHGLHQFEDRLAEQSVMRSLFADPVTRGLIPLGSVGDKAVLGRLGWLFYTPDVQYVVGRGFLDQATQTARKRGTREFDDAPHADPRQAILDFHLELKKRGITLVLVPIPVKPMIHAEKISRQAYFGGAVPQNASYSSLISELEAQQVLVCDVTRNLLADKDRSGVPQFLSHDTHWTPGAMQSSAAVVATFLKQHAHLVSLPAVGYQTRAASVTNVGDIAAGLPLDHPERIFPPQTVEIEQVVQPDGGAWSASKNADVLLLGDSFTNIYSLPEMRWGDSAGFAEHLSLALQRPVDVLAQNDNGAFATRLALARRLAQGDDRLTGKRVIVWEFSMREFSRGDWKPVSLRMATEAAARNGTAPKSTGREQRIRGTIRAVAGVPRPGSVPYREAITTLHLIEVQGLREPVPDGEVVVYVWGLRDNRAMRAAGLRPGEAVSLQVTSWSEREREFGRFNRIELDDPEFRLISLPTFWGELDEEAH